MALAPERVDIGIGRYYTQAGTHPYELLQWELRDSRISDYRTGAVAFEQLGVEVPVTWSMNATNILAQKYFRGTLGTPERERSLRQVIDRVVDTITSWGLKDGYFADGEEASAFSDELKYLVATQKAAFNSPVWFNIGVNGVPQQASACFILAVNDSMNDILNWYVEEGTIFKGGSGSGINLSKIRSSKELLRGGGTASGPVSFMRGADASAGTIKSGGKTRRAAKMVILDADHPDVEEFVWCKAKEERKARALAAAGFDMDLDGADSHSIQYQNANNSVRVTDEFMEAVLGDRPWELTARTTGEVIETLPARKLFREIAEAAWECADPGLQYDTTINRWHTAANTGRINGSNPCSEYVHLDNSACNLASLNLLAFLAEDGSFDVDGFKHAVEVVFTAQEILVGNADYPTEKIAETTRAFRELGLGYANLGAMLMALGLPYDSDEGRAITAAVTALMTGHAYATSARTAARLGPFAGYHDNVEPMLNVLRMHRAEVSKIDEELVPEQLLSAAQESWDSAVELAEVHGVRNSQATVLAPTGCLVGGTLVPTERGLVRLRSLGDPDGARWQDLNIDVASEGGSRNATKFFVNGLEPVVQVRTARGYRLRGTALHRVKVVDRNDGSWTWRRLADLEPGELVPIALGGLVGEPRQVPLPPLPEPYWTSDHHVSVPRTMSPELAEVVGYFMGDGSLHGRGIRFCVSAADDDVVLRLQVLGKELFGIEAKLAVRTGYTEVRFDSVPLVLWWEACGFAKQEPVAGHSGKGYKAHVPDAVLYSNDEEVYAAFIRGVFEADGDATAGYPTLRNTSLELVEDLQILLAALGIPTNRQVERRDKKAWGGAPLARLRVLNVSYCDEWLQKVGFMGHRKQSAVHCGNHPQTARKDHIPVPRSLVDRLAPQNDRLRKVLLLELSRTNTVSRRLAEELFTRTKDSELGRLLSFFYDEITSAELGEEEYTYDLSVPDNVTYVANGFVSHNTISFLMDCDTTGIEPDLGLVKTKKLVGGGTMSIVNQTIPRALRRLGYKPKQIDQIVAYIDEHKSIVGAPQLKAQHLPVFACSMGDNTIHYSGHVKMMAAAQPFISGAISKTVNLPEDVTVEDVEQLHVDAWRMGLKAVAVYRDNCKVAQPLSTTKKEAERAPEIAELTAKEDELEARIAELETALSHQTAKTEAAQAAAQAPAPTNRVRLPRHRSSKTFSFRVADCEGYVMVGEYEDGRPGEVFLKVSKQGSTLSGVMDAFAIAVSLGLQHGVPLSTFVRKYTNMRFEPAGITDDPDLRLASSLVDYIFRRLALDYLSEDERIELGVLSTKERTQPTLPGMEDVEVDPTAARRERERFGDGGDVVTSGTPVAVPSRAVPETRDAPFCYSCGNLMQRAGSCYACPSCGATSGCS